MTDEYEDRAYSPFCEKVEEVLVKIDDILKDKQILKEKIQKFNEFVCNKENNFPAIDMTVQFEEFNHLLRQFRKKKRLADKDHEFALIWEHFKDRQVIIFGFS